MFPSTSFWGTPWRLAALIAFSASSVLFQMLPFAYSTYVSMSFFDLTNKLPVGNFFLFFGLLWKAGDAGHRSPFLSHAKRALYYLRYIPLRKWGANAISNLSSVNAIVERSSFAYHSKNGFVDAGHQSMRFSHANRLPFRLTCPAGGVQRSYLFHAEVFDYLICRVRFSSTSFWGTAWRFAALIAFSAGCVLFQMLPFAYSTYVSMSFFDLTNKLPVDNFLLIFGLLWKAGDAGHRSPYLLQAKWALYYLSCIPVEETGSECHL